MRPALRRLSQLTVFALLATTLVSTPSPAFGDRWDPPAPQPDRLVEGEPVLVAGPVPDLAEERALKAPPETAWPEPGVAEVEVGASGATKAADLPLRIGPAADAAAGSEAPGKVRVELLDAEPPAESPAGPAAVPLRVTRADGGGTGAPVRVTVDYSRWRHAYGGDWAARLRLAELPPCPAAEAGTAADCPAPRPVKTSNDLAAGTLSADLTAAPAASVASGAGLYAVMADPAGGTGDFRASSLAPSAKWQVSAQTGDFSWSYPLRIPPSLGGPTPQLALTYSAGSVDGRTVSTNNQPSWAGEGFDFTPGGFVERKYKSCNDDGVTPKNGEQCWGGDNATLMLGGRSTELVLNSANGVWRTKHDDGSRVEKLGGAVNGDNEGEHWKVTTPDGTQYFFGLNRLPGWTSGKQETASAWTVPVYGDDAGEPCHASAYADSWCRQAYRWNLDHVIDTHGNTLSYFYTQETNHYGRNLKAADETPYTAGGYLQRLEYGQRAGQVYTAQPVAKVLFAVAERCLVTATFDCAPAKLTKANAAHWPDVPADQLCAANANCANHAPTFFTRKRLTKVTTQVLSGGAYADVDSWTFTHTFPRPGDGMSAALWLEKIQHTGHAGGTQAMPAVDFDGVEMANRVDAREGIAPMMKWRIRNVNNETGGRMTVNYSGPDCTRASLPAAHANGRRCFPTYWAPEGATDPYLDWFHKYLAIQVLEADLTGGSPIVRTDYSYQGSPAWAYDDQELVPPERRTWSQWRGYEKVQVTKGESSDVRTATEHLFFRGMHGDKQPSGTRSVQVTDSEGVKVDDHWRLAGFERETRYLMGPGGAEQSGTINDPWLSGPTASGGGDQAYLLDTAKVRSRSKLSTGAWRRTETRRAFDGQGAIAQIDDLGDTGSAADDRCTRFTYTRNNAAWIMTLPSRTETVSVACGAQVSRPADVVGDARMSYDGGAHGAAPTKGDLTRVEELDSYSGSTPRYVTISRSVYDAYGRVSESYDAMDRKTTTAYTPATGGPVTRIDATNPLGHVTTTWLRPEWGAMAAEQDPNGRRADLAYDPLGRLTKVWLPGRAPSQPPNGEFTYLVRTDGPVAITTKTLREDDTYTIGHELYDGFLRPRQTQLPAHGGGRLLTDTVYNTLGQVAKKNDVWANADPPSTSILGIADASVPAQTVFGYDALGRVTSEALKVMGAEKWRTTTTYAGERVDVDPPQGAVPTSTVLDARGRTVELWQYKGASPAGDHDVTKYAYGPNGLESSVTDPAGNVWRTHYDLRERVVRTEDPDKGATTYTYDALDQVTSSTDARGRTLAFAYDALGRRTAVHEGSASGPKLTEWTYDTLADGTQVKGLPVSSVRYAGGAAYTTRMDEYDTRYRPTSISTVIPATEGALAGTYTYESRHNLDGTLASVTYPAAGGLPEEIVRTGYTDLGLPLQTRSSLAMYVNDTLYNKQGEPLQERWGAPGAQVLHDYTYEEGTRRVLRHLTDRETASQVRQADVAYGYDQAGNITRIADTPPAANAAPDAQCFSYDHLRRLREAWTPAGGQCATAPATAALGGAAPYWHSYTYDGTGGRLTETRHATGGDTTATYAYPAAGGPRPHALREVTTSGPAGTRLDTYGYDDAGNMSLRKIGSVEQRMEWDAEGHLSRITEPAGQTTFVYDPDGSRLIRRDPQGTTLFLPGMEVRLAKGASAPTGTRYYQHGDETVAARTSAGGLTWLMPDHNGTAQMSMDAATLQVSRRRLDPFGNPRGAQAATWPGERGFIGGVRDPYGLIHLGAREYDPATGRFVSVDPVMDPGDPQNLNGYAYSANSPVTFSDPTGLREICGIAPGECEDAPHEPSKPPSSGGGSGGNPPPSPPPAGPSQGDQDEAKRTANKTWVDVALEAGGEIIKEIIGYNDVRDCMQGNIGACAMAVAGVVPWFKIGKALKGVYRAAKAILAWVDRLKWARRVMKEADDAAAAAAKYQDDLAKWKKAQEAANAAKKTEAGPPGSGGGLRAAPKGVNLPTVRTRGPSCPNSFAPGTTVLMADGTRVPIERVEIGDEVLATDPETGETAARPVVATIIGEGDKHLTEITVDTDGPRGDATGVVVATHNHPIWVESDGRWTDATDVEPGDTVLTPDGNRLPVISVTDRHARLKVHNLTIDGIHTYYVTAGTVDLLVHNSNAMGCGPTHRDNVTRNKQRFNEERAAAQRGASPGGPEITAAQWRKEIGAGPPTHGRVPLATKIHTVIIEAPIRQSSGDLNMKSRGHGNRGERMLRVWDEVIRPIIEGGLFG